MKESTLLKDAMRAFPSLSCEQVLGPNWETVNNFWFVTENASYDKKLIVTTKRQQVIIHDEYLKYLNDICHQEAPHYRDGWVIYGYGCGVYPIKEIIAMHRIIEDGRQFQYLPLFECLYDEM